MNTLISSSLLRYSAREMQVQKCFLHVNNTCIKYTQLRPVLSNNGFSPQRITKYFLSSTSISNGNVQNQENNFFKNNQLHSLYGQKELRSGILKSGLFKNSLWLPGKLNVRHESTSSVTDTLSEAANEVKKSGLSFDKDSLEVALQDLSESILAKFAQECLESVHNFTGLPWWGTIILSTFIVKSTLLFPFALQQRRALIGLENAQKAFNENLEIIRDEITLSMKQFKWPVEFAKTRYREMMKEIWKNALREERTHPFKPIFCILIQFTTWISMSVAFGNMCCAFPLSDPEKERVYSEMTTGGIGWLNNLTVPDSSLILPLSIGLISLSIIGINYMNYRNPTIVQKMTSGMFACLSIGATQVAMQMPSGLVLYWLTSTAYSLVFNLILLTPVARHVLNIPELKTEIQLLNEAVDKLPEHQKKLQSGVEAKRLKRKSLQI